MVEPQFSQPDPQKPLEVLNVYDGLEIDAECWKSERRYQQQRQNLHYRSLQQPGIVRGLGVRLLEPEEIPPKAVYRDGRWLEIEPGIAIDIEGNPIIISTSLMYRVQDPRDSFDGFPTWVYLYVSYHEPEAITDPETGEILRNSENKFLAESFEINQQTQQLQEGQVELCRILLQPGNFTLKEPADVFNPGTNELDFRDRMQATWRTNQQVKVGLLVSSEVRDLADLSDRDLQTRENLSYLMQAVEPLYPRMQGVAEIEIVKQSVAVIDATNSSAVIFEVLSQNSVKLFSPEKLIHNYNLLYIGVFSENRELNDREIQLLRSYLELGGLLAIEVSESRAAILKQLKQFSSQEKPYLMPSYHRIFSSPFLFPKFPKFGKNKKEVELWQLGNIIAIVGELSSSWGRELDLPRSEIRTAHEFGINLLSFIRTTWEYYRCFQWKN